MSVKDIINKSNKKKKLKELTKAKQSKPFLFRIDPVLKEEVDKKRKENNITWRELIEGLFEMFLGR